AQQRRGAYKSAAPDVSSVWVADNGDGTYKNPVLNADYSDPDAIRVGNDFYLVSSSFEDIPGLPILHSKDLVNWTIIGHALLRQPPFDHFSRPQHGNGVWAPALRYHNGEFYLYYPDPDFGIYLVKAKNAAGPWSEPLLVAAGKGLIDPCPLWDDNGQGYLVHAFAGSRAGIKSIIVINQLNKNGTALTDEGRLVYDGHENDPTIEGPKIYKRNGYYYIFAPAGGVPTGWQLALRSKNIYGPYERKVVMDQGGSTTNGPHQGAWVTTQTGEDWFLHFQDKGAYGRVVHLQPMKWVNDWPVMGVDKDGDGKGEPVLRYKKPNTGVQGRRASPAETDEFNGHDLGLQWQWMANPKSTWAFLYPEKGVLKLYSDKWPDSTRNLWGAPNVLLQKFPADEFTVTTKLTFTPNTHIENEKAGLTIMGFSYANIAVKSKKDGLWLVYTLCKDADQGKQEQEQM
ncbi:MAG TPA: glycoside hydrolase 43 family protein, partial [Chitinophagaceae bacterium]|nr:glycoside hydrolase 43 family protein [Chitinophagaceae bacterium]